MLYNYPGGGGAEHPSPPYVMLRFGLGGYSIHCPGSLLRLPLLTVVGIGSLNTSKSVVAPPLGVLRFK